MSTLSIGQLVGYVDLDTSAGEKAAGMFSGMLDNLGGSWGKILGGAGLAAGGIFGASLAGAMDLEPARDRVVAALDLNEKQAERAGKVAGSVYAAGWGESSDEVSGAVEAVMSSIKGMRSASTKELRQATRQALTFASVMGVDVTRAAQVAGNMVANGMAKDASDAFDLLTKTSSKVPVQLREDVLDAVDEYGQFFSTLGIKGPQAMAMLAEGAKKGMYGIDKAGDAVKEFTIRSTDMSTSSVEAYNAIGLNAEDMANRILKGGGTARKATNRIIDGLLSIKDPAKRANASIALFGTPLEDLTTKEIPTFLRSLKGGSKELGKWRGATDKAGTTMSDNAKGNLTVFGRKIKTEVIDLIGGKVLPAVTDWTGVMNDKLGPAIGAVSDALSGMGGTMFDVLGWMVKHTKTTLALATVLTVLAAVTAAHNAVMTVSAAGGMAKWLLQTNLISSATKVWAAVQWALTAAINASPIGILTMLLAGVALALYVAYKKSDTFRKIVNAAFTGVQKGAGKVLSWLARTVRTTIEFVRKHWLLIGSILLGPLFYVAVQIVRHWDKISGAIRGGISKVIQFVKANWVTILATLVAGPFGLAVALVVKHWGRIRSAVTSGAGKVLAYMRSVPGKVKESFSDAGSLLYGIGQDIVQSLINGITSKIGAVTSKLSSLKDKIRNPLGRYAPGALTPIGQAIIGSLIEGLVEGADGMESVLDKVQDQVSDLFGDRAKDAAAAIEARYDKALDARKKSIERKYDGIEKSLRKRLKGDKLSKALARSKAQQDRALDKAERANNKGRKGELKATEESTKKNQTAVLAVMRQQRAALIANAAAQELMVDQIKEAKDVLEGLQDQYDSYAESVKSSFRSFADITQFAPDSKSMLAGLKDKVAQAEAFRDAMNQLIADGLDPALLDQIKEKGVDGGLAIAEGLVDGGPSAIADMNALSAQLDAAAVDLGANLADRMYGEGIAAQQQLVDGLLADQTALVAAGTSLAQAFMAAMNAELSKQSGITFSVATQPTGAGSSPKPPRKPKDKGGKDRTIIERSGPLIGTVVQRKGESADELAEKLWYKTRKRG